MSDIRNQLIKDSYNYVLQSDLSTGVVYRIGGDIPVNPIFQSGLTINSGFTYSNGTEQLGYVMTCDALGNANWAPASAATPSSGVTSISVGNGLSANSSTGAVTIVFTGSTGTSGDYLPLSGGTVTGNTTFTSGLTVNYIDFDTTPNVPAPTGGTLYFDSNENALSYKPITPSNDVTVNLGQESLIRIYNNLGFQITNGQALHITGATSGTATVSLAVGTGGDAVQFQISGIATHDIPDSSFGFMTEFGVVRDINLTGFTVGEQVYLSQTVPGAFASYSELSFTGRTCEVGHVLDNSASGKIQVTILNEIEGTIITTQENNILVANNSSTGVFQFSGLTIDTPSGTTFSVGALEGWIIDNVTAPANPTIQLIIYSGSSNNTALYVSSATETYILLTSASTIIQQTTFPTPQQRRQNLYLGKFGHGNRQFLINAFNEPDSALSPISQLRDMFTAVKLINDGVIASANAANLNINTSAGVLYGLGIGYVTNKLNPNSLTINSQSPATFQYRTQTGGTAVNTTLIDPLNYDVGGVITPITGVKATNQRIYLLQNGQIRIQYGQEEYNQLAAAVAALQNEVFVTFPNFRDNGILIGVLSILSGCDDLTDTSKAQFFSVSKFGELIGAAGGTSTTTLQQAYNNSSEPEIVINSTLDGVSIQNGTENADNITQLLQGKNTAGNVTSFIRADGAISGTTFFGNGGNLSHIFNSVRINNTPQFSASTNTFINFSGINLTITSDANNTLIFSAGTGGSGGSGTSITSGVFTYTGNTFSGGTLTLTDTNNNPIIIPGLRDTFVTGGTYNGSNILFTNNSGGTFTVTGLTASGLSANYYGSFSDNTNQVVSGANIPTVWRYSRTELSNGISVVDNTKITVQNTGVYEIGYSPQIEKTQGTDALVTIWASINGNPVVRSSSTFGLVANSTLQLPFVSFIFELNANDYVEFYFSSNNEYVQLTALSGLVTPTRPDSPSVIIVAKQVGLSTTAGATGDTFVTGFSLSNDVITLTQNRSDQYSAFTISLSAYTGSTGVSGDYLPLSGGTVTGATNFTAGLNVTGNTILSGLTTVYGVIPVSAAIKPGVNNSYDLGEPSFRWREIYTTNIDATNTITTPYLYANTIFTTTISATTYDNLPGSSSANCVTTFFVTNISGCSPVNILSPLNVKDGLSVTGTSTFTSQVNFTGGLSASTFSASTYQNLPSFNSVQINGITQFSGDTNNYINFSGVGITIASAATNTLAFTNAGVTSITAGSGLSGNSTTGDITLVTNISASSISDSTTVGQNLVKLTNPSAITYLQVNANNTVSTLTSTQLLNNLGSYVVTLGGDVSITALNTTLADVTGLSFPITSGSRYKFTAYLLVTTSAANTGLRFGLNADVAVSTVNYTTRHNTGLQNGQFLWFANAFDSVSSNTGSLASNHLAIMEGFLVASNTGTAIVRFSKANANAGTLTVKANSFIEYQIL